MNNSAQHGFSHFPIESYTTIAVALCLVKGGHPMVVQWLLHLHCIFGQEHYYCFRQHPWAITVYNKQKHQILKSTSNSLTNKNYGTCK